MRPGYRPALEVYTGLLDSLVGPQTRLLDVGCGPGGIVKKYAGLVDFLCGVDQYVTHFEEPAEIVTLVEGDIESLPFADSSVTLVTCSWVLEHVRHPAQLFTEIHRVLRPGGQFVFITPNALNYAVWMRRLIPNAISKPIVKAIYGRDEDFINPTYYRASSFRTLDRLLASAGFRCVRFDHIGDPTYLAINEPMFRLAVAAEAAIDRLWPSSRVHLVGHYRKMTN
jgi:ubiquinone/menaquinone biosynthesis C-methylase UbiE